MRIEHVAIWVKDLEKMKAFYETYFNGESNEKYHNESKGFESYFLKFGSGARLEIMRKIGIDTEAQNDSIGWAHVAFSLGSKEKVNELTMQLQNDGFVLINGPRVTGDGYYESVMEDPEGNLIELTI
jgi:lactoylglutathione lyase